MDQIQKQILDRFQLDSEAVSCEPYGSGHINVTRLVICASGKRYILQKINDHIFKDVAGLMRNIRLVTDHLRKEIQDPRGVLTIVQTTDGKDYIRIADGYYRVYDFVEDSLCLQQPETDEDFLESARAFGSFQQSLKSFPADQLVETIPNFHNTPDRYRIFKEVLARDVMGRACEVEKEIEFVLSREAEMSRLQGMLAAGELPLRVTHNDTKLNNVLLDAKTRKPLCIIDLDTVMPGLSHYDFGDSIRFGAATAAEDELDLDKMTMSLPRFEAYARGYIGACPDLTPVEVENLPLGAKTITLENGMRFLTDYLDGDHYFAIHREGHNKDRCRTQFRLVEDMEKKWDEMGAIIRNIQGK